MFNSFVELENYCLNTIKEGQLEDGEFKTFLFFPGKSENGWIYAQPSVFLSSSIAIALLGSENEMAKSICLKAAAFVRSQMEDIGLWRFYPHHGLFKFNTPMDVDDTSLASYLLEKCNIQFPDNRKYLLDQIDSKGNFYVWFLPRLRYIKAPKFLFRLIKDLRFSFPIFFPMKGRTTAALINYNDHEHAVSSNAILYLKKSKETQASIHHLTEDILFGNEHNLFFYPDFLFTLYHVSRAYDSGITDFYNLKEKVKNYLIEHRTIVFENVLNKAISLIILLNYKIEIDLVEELKEALLNSEKEVLNKPYPYFCTKDRNMVGGSIEFTCATVFNAIQKYQLK